MEREDSDATQIKSNGWRQGSVLPAALVAILRENDLLPWELSVNNQAVRSHNAAVRTRRERIKNELAKLSRSSTTTRYVVFRGSVSTMHQSYVRLENWADTQQLPPEYDQILDFSERETANSLRVMTALDGVPPASEEQTSIPDDRKLT